MPTGANFECRSCEGQGSVETDEAGWHTPPGYERLQSHTCIDCQGDGRQHCEVRPHRIATREIIVSDPDIVRLAPRRRYVSEEGLKDTIDDGYMVTELRAMPYPTKRAVLHALGFMSEHARRL
jgi:hypothetical protein